MHVTTQQIRWALISVFVLLVSVAFHELGHAIMADRLGDDTPRRQGRVTLNPLAHADVIGTLILPFVGGLYGFGFGWGKPVQWQPARIDRKWRMATAQILVAIAGPAMNIVLAVVLGGITTLLWHEHVLTLGQPYAIIQFAIITNFILFFFNLIPAPPLDGGHVAQGLTPYKYRAQWDQIARFGPFVIIAVVMIPQLQQIFVIPALWCSQHLYSLLGIPFLS